jgi:hypothetical protein
MGAYLERADVGFTKSLFRATVGHSSIRPVTKRITCWSCRLQRMANGSKPHCPPEPSDLRLGGNSERGRGVEARGEKDCLAAYTSEV